jgi:endoglucanase
MKITTFYKRLTQYAAVSVFAITGMTVLPAQAQCTATAITPYLNANNTGWTQTTSATINSGNTVIFGPQPTTGGSWSWAGCGTSGTAREQTKNITASCTATATYKNSCGATSTKAFNITVSTAFVNCTTTTSDPDGDGFGWENNKTCIVVNRSAMQITGAMGVGWNLGNSLDASVNETNWGNPTTTKAMIDKVRSAGFTTLRVPVSWDDHVSGSSYTIASAWLDRVEQVANYGIANDMFVIVNVHHNNGWEAPTYSNETNARDRLTKLWQQIAVRFNKYGDKVIFETMNEPRAVVNGSDDWWGVQENFDVVNRLNAAAVSTIRATGGNNGKRLIMVPGYVAGANDHQIDAIVLPNDSKLAVSTHAYFPFGFALDAAGTSIFSTTDVDDVFARLNTKFISKGIAVVMGEWASTN